MLCVIIMVVIIGRNGKNLNLAFTMPAMTINSRHQDHSNNKAWSLVRFS